MPILLPSHPSAVWGSALPGEQPDRPASSYDVAVVGGGITGLTTALLLARAGLRPVVLERSAIGSGTTGRSTAKASLLQGARAHQIRSQHGSETLAGYVEGTRRAVELISGRLDARVSWQTRAAWSYATDDQGARSIEQEYAALTEVGVPVQDARPSELPFSTTAALCLPDQLQIDPVQYVRALAEDVRSLGGDVCEQAMVVGVDGGAHGGPLTVQLRGGGSVQADWVVLATLHPFPRRTLLFSMMQPTRSYVVTVRPGSVPLPEGMYLSVSSPTRSLRTVEDADGGRQLMIGGNGHPTGHSHPTLPHVQDLADWAAAEFGTTEVQHRWSAQDFVSADVLPHVGPAPFLPDRVLVGTGFGKWGITSGTAAAIALSATVTGSVPEWAESWRPRVPHSLSGWADAARINAEVGEQLARGWVGAAAHAGSTPPEGHGVVVHEGVRPRAISTVDGVARRCSAVCTHLGGIVRWNDAERSWDCPLHGSRFDPDGHVLEAPATRDLAPG